MLFESGIMQIIMEELISKIDYLSVKEKSIRSRILLEKASNNLKEYHKIKNELIE